MSDASEAWMVARIRAGDKIAVRLLKEGGNPVHPGVEIGRAAGALAAKLYERDGEAAAKNFMQTMVAVFNLETARVTGSTEMLSLKSPAD